MCIHNFLDSPILLVEIGDFWWKWQYLLKSIKMCLMCAHHKKILFQTKVYYYAFFCILKHLFSICTHGEILAQSLERSNFSLQITFDQKIIYDFLIKGGTGGKIDYCWTLKSNFSGCSFSKNIIDSALESWKSLECKKNYFFYVTHT